MKHILHSLVAPRGRRKIHLYNVHKCKSVPVLAQAVLDLLHYLGCFSFLVFLAMSRHQREETLGRQGLFKKLCRLMAPSRVRQPLLGEITIEEVPSSVRSAPAWMAIQYVLRLAMSGNPELAGPRVAKQLVFSERCLFVPEFYGFL